jgi:hypothetical protein
MAEAKHHTPGLDGLGDQGAALNIALKGARIERLLQLVEAGELKRRSMAAFTAVTVVPCPLAIARTLLR